VGMPSVCVIRCRCGFTRSRLRRVYTPGIARDHGYHLAVLGVDRFCGRSVLDVGAFDGFYSFLRRPIARAGLSRSTMSNTSTGCVLASGSRFGWRGLACDRGVGRIAGRLSVHGRARSAPAWRALKCRVVFWRLAPGDRPDQVAGGTCGCVGSGRRDATCTRDDFVHWDFPAEGLRRLTQIVGLEEIEVVDEPDVDVHPRILALLRTAG